MMRDLPPPSQSWAYFLDLDGTLVNLAATPDAVRLSAPAHDAVRSLVAWSGGAVAVVSGRSIADLDRILGAPPLPASGQHGLEWRDAAESASISAATSPAMTAVRAQLAAFAATHEALLIEDKGLSLAVHYRRSPELSSIVHEMMTRQLAQLGTSYRLQHGKCVVELRPAGGGKASAIGRFMQRRPFRGRVPVFIGDDETDEEGFVLVNDAGGVSIHVGEGPTTARWTLPNPDAVVSWLSLVESRAPAAAGDA